MTTIDSAPPLRSAVIGCGAISKEHLDYLAHSPRAEIVGVCDLSPAIAEWTAQRYETSAFTDHSQMLALTAPQVVHVLTPPRSHLSLALQSLDAGAHVVVEKPIAASASEVERLYDAADQHGLLVIENQNYRFNDGVTDVRALIDAGSLGTVTEVDVRIQKHLADTRFADPNIPNPLNHLAGGALRDFLPHMVGLVLDLSGATTVEDVTARWRSELANDALGLDGLDASFTANGTIGRLYFSSTSDPEGFTVTVRGTHGTVMIDLWQPHQLRYLRRGPAVLNPLLNQMASGSALVRSAVRGFGDKVMQHLPYHGIERLLDAFYLAVQTGGNPPLNRDDIALTARTVDVISGFVDAP